MAYRQRLMSSAFCVLLVVGTLHAQGPSQVYSHLERALSTTQAQDGKGNDISRTELVALLKKEDPGRLLAFLRPYIASSNVTVRSQALALQVMVAELHRSIVVRREVVDTLVSGLVSGGEVDQRIRRKYDECLRRFTATDFSDGAKATLIKAVNSPTPTGEVIRACGVAQLRETLPRLAQLTFDEIAYSEDRESRYRPKWYYTQGWVARLARARMGVKEDIDKCIQMVEMEENVHERVVRLLPHIAYVRQPAAMECLKTYFLSDLKLSPMGPWPSGEPASNYLMPILADSLVNFPVERKEHRNYTQEERNAAKEWISAQTTWQIRR